MRHTPRAETGTETRMLLAATLACYLACFACLLGVTYSLASLAAHGASAGSPAVREGAGQLESEER